jgi:hypothetical protein
VNQKLLIRMLLQCPLLVENLYFEI